MRFVDEAIEVDVHVGLDGQVVPTAFTWRGRRYAVTGLGRTYSRAGDRYVLVMTPGDQVFELRWHAADNRWFLARAPQERGVAG